MKYILSTAILALASISPIVNAVPAAYDSSYNAAYPVTPSFTSVDFPCGYDVENWVIEAGFGTPPQKAKLLVDTTFDNTFVAGVMCHSEFCENQSGSLYHAGKSSTSTLVSRKKTYYLTEGRTVKGDVYKDTITLGDAVYQDELFGKAFSVEGFPAHANYAGVLGLNPTPESADPVNNSTPAPGYGYSNHLRKRSEWSIAEVGAKGNGSQKPPKVSSKKGKRNNYSKECSLTFGIDYSAISSVAWLNFPTCEYGKTPFWKTDLECVKINGVADLKFTNTIAEFDTTVKDIHAPHSDVAKIHQGLKATYNSQVGRYVFECCEARDLEISFADYIVTIPVESWTFKVDTLGDHCAAKISVSNTEEAPTSRWRLGTDFMENFYTIFSPIRNQTGLALTHGQDPSFLTLK